MSNVWLSALLAVTLQDTTWILTHVGETPMAGTKLQSAASIVFARTPARFSGSTGCNRLAGTYELREQSITFGPAMVTKMACAGGMDVETAFLDALPKVRAWRIAGRTLELLDAGGQAVLRFDARSSPAP